jgi:hypothetical protein
MDEEIDIKDMNPPVKLIILAIIACIGVAVIGYDVAQFGWKTRKLEVGQVWVKKGGNPFDSTTERKILSLKDGYVKYSYGVVKNGSVKYNYGYGPITDSIEARAFVVNSKMKR